MPFDILSHTNMITLSKNNNCLNPLLSHVSESVSNNQYKLGPDHCRPPLFLFLRVGIQEIQEETEKEGKTSSAWCTDGQDVLLVVQNHKTEL